MQKLLYKPVYNGQTLYSYLQNRPYLTLIKDDVLGIAKRIQKYDPSFFVAFNSAKEKYEVHNIENNHNTYCFTVEGELDSRTLHELYKTDSKVHGVHTLFDELELQNEKEEQANKKELKDTAHELARETSWHWKKAFELM